VERGMIEIKETFFQSTSLFPSVTLVRTGVLKGLISRARSAREINERQLDVGLISPFGQRAANFCTGRVHV
jgi:hypothetical protein